MGRVPFISLVFLAGCSLEADVGSSRQAPPTPIERTRSTLSCGSEVDLGRMSPDTPSSGLIECEVTGDLPVVVEELRWRYPARSGFDASAWIGGVERVLPAELPASTRFTIRIDFSSGTVGLHEGLLEVRRYDGVSPTIRTTAEVARNLSCDLRSVPELVDFGAVGLGEVASTTFTLTNHGSGSCSTVAPRVISPRPGAFHVEDSAAITFAPGEQRRYRIEHGPTAAGDYLGHVIAEDVSSGSVLEVVPMRSRALDPSVLPSIQPRNLDFGRRASDCSNATTRTFSITAGSEPLSASLALASESSAAFFMTAMTTTIAAGETASFPVLFHPSAGTGDHDGRVVARLGALDSSEVEVLYLPLTGMSAVDSITEQTFRGASPYQLVGPPVFQSAEVWLDGQYLEQTWEGRVVWAIDYVRHQLILIDIPRADAEIRVRYEQHCVRPSCGNGLLEPGEACDDGNQDEFDGCLSGCRLAHCGDGFVRSDGSEACDDGNRFNGDGCNALCQIEACGNGVIEGLEQCDAGPLASDVLPDTCRTDCTLPHCGDGVRDATEQCDDGNQDSLDACIMCVEATCGDGFVREGVEECDDGNSANGDACTTSCTYPNFSHSDSVVEPYPIGAIPVGARPLTGPLALPFSFTYLGQPVSSIDGTMPGVLTFDGIPAESMNRAIPSTTDPRSLIAWWWDDLIGIPHYWIIGGPGAQILILQYDELRSESDPSVAFSARLQLHERNGHVVVHYGPLTGSSNAGSATVGWEMQESGRGHNVVPCSPSCGLDSWPADAIHVYAP